MSSMLRSWRIRYTICLQTPLLLRGVADTCRRGYRRHRSVVCNQFGYLA